MNQHPTTAAQAQPNAAQSTARPTRPVNHICADEARQLEAEFGPYVAALVRQDYNRHWRHHVGAAD